jgi:hypothetical protein
VTERHLQILDRPFCCWTPISHDSLHDPVKLDTYEQLFEAMDGAADGRKLHQDFVGAAPPFQHVQDTAHLTLDAVEATPQRMCRPARGRLIGRVPRRPLTWTLIRHGNPSPRALCR